MNYLDYTSPYILRLYPNKLYYLLIFFQKIFRFYRLPCSYFFKDIIFKYFLFFLNVPLLKFFFIYLLVKLFLSKKVPKIDF